MKMNDLLLITPGKVMPFTVQLGRKRPRYRFLMKAYHIVAADKFHLRALIIAKVQVNDQGIALDLIVML